MMKFWTVLLFCYLTLGSAFAQTYRVGDVVVNADGSKGVVFWVDAEGKAGWMVALHDLPSSFQWGPKGQDIPELENVGASPVINEVSKIFQALADTAGYGNTFKMREYWGKGTKWPAQAVDFENGWYIPAAGQMRRLFTSMLFIRQILLDKGGEDLKDGYYWTSTEYNADQAWYVYCNPGEIGFAQKNSVRNIRPVRSFKMRKLAYDRTLSYAWNTGVAEPYIKVAPLETTDYNISVENAAGCVAETTHSVFVASGRDTVIVASICPGERYTENGFDVSKTDTTYVRVLESAEGCSMQITLELFAKQPVITEFETSVCEGEIYTENNFSAWKAGRYEQKWVAANGCDSTVILDLKVNPVYHTTLPVTICEGEYYTFNGVSYTETGSYSIPLLTNYGCDSLISLLLTVNPVARDTLRKAVCEGDVYSEQGFHVSTAGIYCDTLSSVFGCDSIRVLDFSVLPILRDTLHGFICQGETYDAFGFYESESGFYSDTLQSRYFCDSIVTLDLIVRPVYQDTLRKEICQGERYTFHGFDYEEEGEYVLPLSTVSGCDSIITLLLKVHPTYCFDSSVRICEGETYLFRGQQVGESRVYEDILTTSEGCDSLYRLDLTVVPVVRDTFFASVCAGDVCEDFGFQVSHPGFYSDTLLGSSLCDSIVTLSLTVNPVYRDTFPVSLCEGETYTGQDTMLSVPGIYSFVYPTSCGCDSTVTILLTVNPVYEDTIRAEICQGESYRLAGFDWSEEGAYRVPLHSEAGCDSTLILFLKVHPVYLFDSLVEICEGERYDFRGNEVKDAGIYEDFLTTQAGCDSLYRLELIVRPLYQQVIDTVLCEGETYHQNGFSAVEAGDYLLPLYSIYGCDSLITLHLRTIDRFEGEIRTLLEDCRSHLYFFNVESQENTFSYIDTYHWDFGDGNSSLLKEPEHFYLDSGTYSVTLQVVREGKCRDSLKYRLTVPAYSEDFEIEVFPEAIDEEWKEIRFKTHCREDRTYEWDMGDGTVLSGCEGTYRYEPDARSFYEIKLTVRNADSCEFERWFRLPVYHPVNPPNTFSPNGDGVNDFFMIGYRLRILNRNGLEIYQGENGWDGTYKNEQVPEDTYFYELFYPTARGIRTKTGYISLIR